MYIEGTFKHYVFGLKNDEDFQWSLKSSALGVIEVIDDDLEKVIYSFGDGWFQAHPDDIEDVFKKFIEINSEFLGSCSKDDLSGDFLLSLLKAARDRDDYEVNEDFERDVQILSYDDKQTEDHENALFIEVNSTYFETDEEMVALHIDGDQVKVELDGDEDASIDSFYERYDAVWDNEDETYFVVLD